MFNLKELLLYIDPEVNFLHVAGRTILLGSLSIWGLRLIFASIDSNTAGSSLLHLINLPFHEAGHILFRIFGRFFSVLGGSFMQLLIPVICLGTFLIKTKDPFAASVALWWAGENFLDMAPYINDARALKLMLLGGVTGADVDDYHDWQYILRKLGLLSCDHALATAAHLFGSILMLTACFWGGYIIWLQFRYVRDQEG
ncbi:MAG: zinc ribbon domain-containing protein [Thermodesulfovibrio sp.]|nr:zinc ribbon domain-containing protein [Thermodesulfovibrio sp.]